MSVINRNLKNQIHIGLIGPQAIIEKMMRIIENFPSFAAVPLILKHEDEAPVLAERISVDGDSPEQGSADRRRHDQY